MTQDAEKSESDNEFDPEFCFSCGGPDAILTSPTLGLIQKAAAKGCPTCSLLEDVIAKYSLASNEYEDVAVIRTSGVSDIIIGPNVPEAIPISIYGHVDPNSIWLALNEGGRSHFYWWSCGNHWRYFLRRGAGVSKDVDFQLRRS